MKNIDYRIKMGGDGAQEKCEGIKDGGVINIDKAGILNADKDSMVLESDTTANVAVEGTNGERYWASYSKMYEATDKGIYLYENTKDGRNPLKLDGFDSEVAKIEAGETPEKLNKTMLDYFAKPSDECKGQTVGQCMGTFNASEMEPGTTLLFDKRDDGYVAVSYQGTDGEIHEIDGAGIWTTGRRTVGETISDGAWDDMSSKNRGRGTSAFGATGVIVNTGGKVVLESARILTGGASGKQGIRDTNGNSGTQEGNQNGTQERNGGNLPSV